VLAAAGLAGRAWAEHLYAQTSGLSVFEAEFGAHGVAVLSRSVLAIGDTFAVGMVVAVLYVWTERGDLPKWTRARAAAVAWTLVVVGSVGGLVLRESHPWFLGTFTSLAAGGVILLMTDPGARRESSMLVRIASWRPIEYLGEISLSLYLWHFPMIILVSRAGLFDTDSLASLVGSVVLVASAATALGAITFAWIERPAMTGQWPTIGPASRTDDQYRVAMPGSFARYRALGRRTVKGWVEPQTLDVLQTLAEAQDREGVDGGIAEIGVHHGKLFIALQLLGRPGAPTVAVDVFDDQELNVDQSGRGDRARFEANVRRWGDWSSVVVKQGDSTQLSGNDVVELAQGPVRLFSVDGGHTEEIVATDMRTAEQALAPGGIVVADDVFNAEWPGVSVGTLRYLDSGGALVPFGIGFNKVYFTDEDHAERFRETIRRVYGHRWRMALKTTVFHGSDVEVLWPTPVTPRAVLRRSRLARKAYDAMTSGRSAR
jgi:hypothetical protein